jgi:hypothetical protein
MTVETRENESADKVHVSVRVRPLNEKERGVGSAWLVTDSTVSHRVRLRLDNHHASKADDERCLDTRDERIEAMPFLYSLFVVFKFTMRTRSARGNE